MPTDLLNFHFLAQVLNICTGREIPGWYRANRGGDASRSQNAAWSVIRFVRDRASNLTDRAVKPTQLLMPLRHILYPDIIFYHEVTKFWRIAWEAVQHIPHTYNPAGEGDGDVSESALELFLHALYKAYKPTP